MDGPPPLHSDLTVLLVDAQAGFFDVMHGDAEAMLARLARLVRLADWLDLPVVATVEAPRQTQGAFPQALHQALPAGTHILEKHTFDATAAPAVADALAAIGRGTIAVAGSETDVCVLLTVEGLLRTGYRVHLLEDCVFSSTPHPETALARMRHAGATATSVKTLMFELTGTVDRSRWPRAWRERLARAPDVWPCPEDLATDL